jgi:MFS family permease
MRGSRIPWSAVLLLGVTQIIGYGTLYYSFSILAPAMARDFGLSSEGIFGILSVALLVGGLTAPSLGVWIDRIGAGRVMTIGSGVAALALIACALSAGKTLFSLTLVVVEVSANLVQYGAAFALIVQIRPDVAQRSITYLTLIAGFASTIFWPVTSVMHAHLSWQQVYLVFAALNLLVAMPIHYWLSMGTRRNGPTKQTVSLRDVTVGTLSGQSRRTGFVLMVVGFSIQSLLSSAILVHMVPILSGLGLGTSAAIIGSLFGPPQVASRFTNMLVGGNLPPLKLAMIASVLMPSAIVVLALSSSWATGAVAFAVVFGLGNGIFSIVTGTLPLQLFGSKGYGQTQGRVMAARLILSATAPFALAYVMGYAGVQLSLAVTAAVGFVAVAAFAAIGLLSARSEAYPQASAD